MATYIQTDDITNVAQVPNNAGTLIRDSQWGIDATIQNCIIQNIQVVKSRITDDTQDQKGSLVSQLDYDEQWQIQMELIGPSDEDASIPNIEVGDTSFLWNEKKWKVQDCTYLGNFQDKKRYQLTLFRSTNFPAQS